MNLLGKILVVLIFAMSLVFMSFAVAVYATHTNWRLIVKNKEASLEQPLGLESVLSQAEAENAKLLGKIDQLIVEHQKELALKTDAITKLEEQRVALDEQVTALRGQRDSLAEESQARLHELDAMRTTVASTRTQIDDLRAQLVEVQNNRNQHAKWIVYLTDLVNSLTNDKKNLNQRNTELTKSLAKAMETLRMFGLDPNIDYRAEGPWGNPEGEITEVGQNGAVQISIGSDDGVLAGHEFDVTHTQQGNTTYVGRIRVVEIDHNSAIAKVDPKYTQGRVIQVGDAVKPKQRTLELKTN